MDLSFGLAYLRSPMATRVTPLLVEMGVEEEGPTPKFDLGAIGGETQNVSEGCGLRPQRKGREAVRGRRYHFSGGRKMREGRICLEEGKKLKTHMTE